MREALKILKIFSFPIVVAIFHFLVIMPFVYKNYLWIDSPMHIIGGFAVAHSFIHLVYYLENKVYLKVSKKPLFSLLIISLVSLIAVLWEFYEFLDSFLGTRIPNTWPDTIKDLFLGLVGGSTRLLIRKSPS